MATRVSGYRRSQEHGANDDPISLDTNASRRRSIDLQSRKPWHECLDALTGELASGIPPPFGELRRISEGRPSASGLAVLFEAVSEVKQGAELWIEPLALGVLRASLADLAFAHQA